MSRRSYRPESDVEGSSPSVPTPYNLVRFRSDTWNRLRDATRRLRGTVEVEDHRLSLVAACRQALASLAGLERYQAFPGERTLSYLAGLFEQQDYEDLAEACVRIVRMLSSGSYRRLDLELIRATDILDLLRRADGAIDKLPTNNDRPYFELLVVDDIDVEEEMALRTQLRKLRDDSDHFHYEVVVVRSFEDAVLAIAANPSIEACVARFSFPFAGKVHSHLTDRLLELAREDRSSCSKLMPGERTARLGDVLRALRPELDLYRVTSAPIETLKIGAFRGVFYQSEDLHDLHLNVLKGVHDRYETPFFDALRAYSERPTGMFHALPVSRARSISKSHWIQDFGNFYGLKLFLAETSTTSGGLDSLLQPTGSLRVAQHLAARAFGADRTFFVTNGTSTANKIVTQALCRPGDIILMSHDCHKSHPYAAILGGACPIYLDSYPLSEYTMYGGVTVHEIKRQLLTLKREGKLDRVRLLLLTNLTFDGITYDPYRVMKEALAIKPGLLFLWDEAWFAYGRFSPFLRHRTAMDAAARLERDLHSTEYRSQYEDWSAKHQAALDSSDPSLADVPLMPDPDAARIRVYATHSTHKTLTALRQGSMIHVRDVDFEREAVEPFHAAYMTHTSTSPNYQILASLDVGRRQVELEGYELVTGAVEMAFTLREQVNQDPLISRYFRALSPAEMVPAKYRPSGLERYYDAVNGVGPLEGAWLNDEFVLDPTRVTVHVGRTGLDGDQFRNLLMSEYGIHINKTSRNTVLFLIHIGMTRGTIAQLLKTLSEIARGLDREAQHASEAEKKVFQARVDSLTLRLPPLPNFSHFHDSFRPDPKGSTSEGDIRRAFFQAYDSRSCEFVALGADLRRAVAEGQEFVSASFVTPYPPGFPVLVPGQVFSTQILDYLLALDVKEIHGYDPELGLRIFSATALQTAGHQAHPSNGHPRTASGVLAITSSVAGAEDTKMH